MNRRARKRILLMIPTLGFGGAETSFLHLKRILEAHHDVVVAVFEPCDVPAVRERCAGGEFRYLDGAGPPNVAPFARVRRWWRRIHAVRKLKKDLKVDVSISFLEGADILNVLTRNGEKTVVSIRGSKLYDPNIRGFQGLVRRHLLWPFAYRQADAVVAVSAGVLAEVANLGFVGRGKLGRTIGLALQVNRLRELAGKPVEPELESLAGRRVIVSWGRISHEKGYQHLLRVFSKVKQRLPAAQLLVIGSGPMSTELLDSAQSLGLSSSTGEKLDPGSDFILAGFRSDPIRYAKLGSVFAFPSYAEGFPNAVVEALAAGLPVFANDGPWGARCLLERVPRNLHVPFPTTRRTEVEFGHLMPRIDQPENDDCWADALAEALDHPESLSALCKAGPVRALDFDEMHAAAAWLDLIDELSIGRPQPAAVRAKSVGACSADSASLESSARSACHVRDRR